MAVLNFTLSEEGVSSFRDALICLNKFSDEVSIEARKDSFALTTINSSKSAYASFKFATSKFFSKYQYHGGGQFRERFYCTIYIRALISLFRSRAGGDMQRDAEKQTLIEKCDVAVEDGDNVKSRFIARIIFRNGLTSTHRLPYEVALPVHAKFNKHDAPHYWAISSRTLRQLTDHFGPGIEFLDINTDGDHVNFTCFSEKTPDKKTVLAKPLQTSIAVEVDEFDEIEVEDKLHIVMSVKDFRAIIQHAGITGNELTARYSLPSRPIQLSYASEVVACEFLIMTVGERGSNPGQKTRKGRKNGPQAPQLDQTSRRASEAPSEAPRTVPSVAPPPSTRPLPPNPTPHLSAARPTASRMGAFDLRPSQKPPPPTLRSDSLFVEDEGWEPVQDEDEEENARLEWNHSADPNPSAMRVGQNDAPEGGGQQLPDADGAEATYTLEPTQRLSELKDLPLFPD